MVIEALDFRSISAQEMARKRDGDQDVVNWKVHIRSENNFPTAAGLASSAAGYAGLGMS